MFMYPHSCIMTFGNYIMTLLPNQGDQTADGGDGRGLPDNEDVMLELSIAFALRRGALICQYLETTQALGWTAETFLDSCNHLRMRLC